MAAFISETPSSAARLARAVLLAFAVALLVTAGEVLSLVLVADRPRPEAAAVGRFALGAWVVVFAGALAPCVAAALLLARPYRWAARALARADRRRARLATLSVGGCSSLVAGGFVVLTVKKATAANLLAAGAVAALVAGAVSALTPVLARHVARSVERERVPRAGLLLCAAVSAFCFGASRFTLRGDYTALHQLYAVGAIGGAALLCLPLVERLARRARLAWALGGLGAVGLVAGLAVPRGSQVARHLLHNRTGVVQYLMITGAMLAGTDALGAAPARAAGGPPAAPPPAPLPPPPADPPPNVVWVMVDTLRADRVGAYAPSSDLTPHLDAFAREAVVFRQARSQATNTVPSVASFLTGRHPALARPGLLGRGRDPARDLPFFLPAPYRAYMASPHYHALAVRDVLAPDAITVLPADLGNGDDADTVDNLLRMLRARPLEPPWFLWITLEGPHARGDVSRRVAYVPYPRLRRDYARTYDAAVRRADAHFGRLVAGLQDLGLYDDALFVVMADHGEALGEHADLFHAKEVYDPSARVPLMFRLPGGAHAGEREVLAELVDIVPTIADLVGLAPAGGPVSGESLRPWIVGERPAGEEEEAWTQAVYMRRKVVSLVRREPDGGLWKAIHDVTNDVTELYDLDADPGEARNLADALPERTAALRARVRAHVAAESAPPFLPITQP